MKLGLRPLAVHFDSGWNSELAVDNIHNLVTRLGLDLYTHVVDWREMRDLQLSFLKASVANADTPSDHAFSWVAYTQARRYGIKTIISGSNAATESVLPSGWGYDAGDARQLKAIQRRFGTVKLRTYPVMGLLERNLWYPELRRVRTAPILDYLPYVYEDAKTELADELGWRDYGGKHYESVFTRYFQGYYLPRKFGYDKRLAHYSSLILSGQLTRDDALGRMETPDYPEELRDAGSRVHRQEARDQRGRAGGAERPASRRLHRVPERPGLHPSHLQAHRGGGRSAPNAADPPVMA